MTTDIHNQVEGSPYDFKTGIQAQGGVTKLMREKSGNNQYKRTKFRPQGNLGISPLELSERTGILGDIGTEYEQQFREVDLRQRQATVMTQKQVAFQLGVISDRYEADEELMRVQFNTRKSIIDAERVEKQRRLSEEKTKVKSSQQAFLGASGFEGGSLSDVAITNRIESEYDSASEFINKISDLNIGRATFEANLKKLQVNFNVSRSQAEFEGEMTLEGLNFESELKRDQLETSYNINVGRIYREAESRIDALLQERESIYNRGVYGGNVGNKSFENVGNLMLGLYNAYGIYRNA